MHCKGKLKFLSHNTNYYFMEVVTKAGLTVICLFEAKSWVPFSSI